MSNAWSPEQWEQFAARLDAVHQWPCEYTFKFIVRTEVVSEFVAIFAGHPHSTRPSKAGKYTSITALVRVTSATEVTRTYRAAAGFDGVVAL